LVAGRIVPAKQVRLFANKLTGREGGMKIHHVVWYLAAKTILVWGLLVSTIALWYLAVTAALYSLMALNAALQLEQSKAEVCPKKARDFDYARAYRHLRKWPDITGNR
jgi:hypothetical protein